MAGIAGSRGKCHFGAQTRRRTVMQPENDTQAVRRVLARAGITAAALTLSLGAAAPVAYACHGGGGDKGDKGGASQGGPSHGGGPPRAHPRDKGGGEPGGSSNRGARPGGGPPGGTRGDRGGTPREI